MCDLGVAVAIAVAVAPIVLAFLYVVRTRCWVVDAKHARTLNAHYIKIKINNKNNKWNSLPFILFVQGF